MAWLPNLLNMLLSLYCHVSLRIFQKGHNVLFLRKNLFRDMRLKAEIFDLNDKVFDVNGQDLKPLVSSPLPPRNHGAVLRPAERMCVCPAHTQATQAHTLLNTYKNTGTQAEKSGLRAGDVIVEVEGRSLAGVAPGDAAHALAGPSESVVSVSARRENSETGSTVVQTTLLRDVSGDDAIAGTVAALGNAQDVERFWNELGIACDDKMELHLKEARAREMLLQRVAPAR